MQGKDKKMSEVLWELSLRSGVYKREEQRQVGTAAVNKNGGGDGAQSTNSNMMASVNKKNIQYFSEPRRKTKNKN